MLSKKNKKKLKLKLNKMANNKIIKMEKENKIKIVYMGKVLMGFSMKWLKENYNWWNNKLNKWKSQKEEKKKL